MFYDIWILKPKDNNRTTILGGMFNRVWLSETWYKWGLKTFNPAKQLLLILWRLMKWPHQALRVKSILDRDAGWHYLVVVVLCYTWVCACAAWDIQDESDTSNNIVKTFSFLGSHPSTSQKWAPFSLYSLSSSHNFLVLRRTCARSYLRYRTGRE